MEGPFSNKTNIRKQVKDNNRKCSQMTGEGLLICCQNSQNIIEKTDVTLKKHLKSTSSLFSGARHLSLPPLGGRLQLPTRWSPSSISWHSYNNGVNHSLFACQNIFGMILLKLTKRRLSIMSSTALNHSFKKWNHPLFPNVNLFS